MKTISIKKMMVQCCSCKKIEQNGKWSVVSEDLVLQLQGNLSHSYCDDCFKNLYENLNLKHHSHSN